MQTLAAAHPVDEEGLNELDNLECDQKADGDQVVEQDDEGEEVEAKVSRPTIYHKTSFRLRKATQESRQRCLTLIRWKKKKAQSYSQLTPDIIPIPRGSLGITCISWN